MKIAYISDLHLRNLNSKTNKNSARKDYLPETILKNLDYIIDYCVNDPRIIHIFFGGDIGDAAIWDSSLIYRTKEILSKAKFAEKEVYTVVGNHDCIGKDWTTYKQCGLGVLEDLGLLEVPINSKFIYYHDSVEDRDRLVRTQFRDRYIHVDFLHADSIQEQSLYDSSLKLSTIIPEIELNHKLYVRQCRIAIAHSSIGPYKTEYLKGVEDLKQDLPFDFLLLADIHKRIEHKLPNGCKVLNPGPVERFGLSEIDETPSFLVLDLEDLSYEFITIPHEPSEEIFSIKSRKIKKPSVDTTNFLNSMSTISLAERKDPKELILETAAHTGYSDEARDLLVHNL